MADMNSNAKFFADDPQRGISAATEFGLSALKPVLHFQVLMLRMWADGIERLTGNYATGVDEVATAFKEQSSRDHAA